MVGLLLGVLGQILALLFLLGAATIVSVWAQWRGARGAWVVLLASLAAALWIFAALFGVTLSDGRFLFLGMRDWLGEALDAFAKNGLKPEQAQQFHQARIHYIRLLPGFLAASCLFIGALAYYPVGSLLSRFTPRVRRPEPFREFAVPEPLIFGLILSVGLLAYGVWSDPDGALTTWGGCLGIFFGNLYFLEGLAVVGFFFWKWKMRTLISFSIYFLIFFSNSAPAIALMGMMDLWVDFRKLRVPPKAEAETLGPDRADKNQGPRG
jgi:uncharacterized protein YybS (DUF2232 family)